MQNESGNAAKNARLNYRIEAELKKAFNKACAVNNTPPSDVIRDLVNQYVKSAGVELPADPSDLL